MSGFLDAVFLAVLIILLVVVMLSSLCCTHRLQPVSSEIEPYTAPTSVKEIKSGESIRIGGKLYRATERRNDVALHPFSPGRKKIIPFDGVVIMDGFCLRVSRGRGGVMVIELWDLDLYHPTY